MRMNSTGSLTRNLAGVTGPGGRLAIGRDEQGRAIVTNFPATVPELFRTFCSLQRRGRSRCRGRRAADLRRARPHFRSVAHGLAARGIVKGDRVGIAIRNCPSWVVVYMAVLKAGAVATLLNGWWEAHEMEHAIQLTDPKLIIADGRAPSGSRRAAPAARF